MRPAVGWLRWAVAPPAEAENAPPTETCPWAEAYTTPSGPRSGVIRSVPPEIDFASPIDETVTSSVRPARENGGTSAVTITPATFFTRTLSIDDDAEAPE